jgi:tetratricopeptide (TPR) repeat protein
MSASNLFAAAPESVPDAAMPDIALDAGHKEVPPEVLQSPAFWNQLGLQFRSKGEADKAIACYQRALKIGPEHAGVWSNVGNAMTELKRLPNAILSHRRALELEPDNETFKTNMVWTILVTGSTLRRDGKYDEALSCFREGLKLSPKNAMLWVNLGRLLLDKAKADVPKDKRGQPEFARLTEKHEFWKILNAAVRAHRVSHRLEPDNKSFGLALAAALSTAGVAMRSRRQFSAALANCREAVGLAPESASAWSNLGNVLKDMKYLESAIECHKRAVALAPESSDCLFNLEVAYSAGMRTHEALETLEKALKLKPNDPDLRWDRALNNLRLGNYAEGWRDYEARMETGALPDRNPPGKSWHGEAYPGQTLLIVSEQGYGDTIWASRYLPRVKALGGTLIVECRKDMVPLVESMGVADKVIAKGTPFPAADLHINICSLPGLYVESAADISGKPYIKPPAEREQKARAAIGDAKGKLKVGIVWSGSTTFKGNPDRAAPLRMFLEAFAMPGVQLYSLQKGPPVAELKALKNAPIIDLAPAMADFADTAAIVAQLDLVIMTDSAVAHLAGAVGTPVWVLLNRAPYWMWGENQITSEWYDSIEFFRQTGWMNWASVFDPAATRLIQTNPAARLRTWRR